MKEREKIQKEFNKYLITFLIGLLLGIGVGISGGVFLDRGSVILGIVLLIIAGLCFIVSIILLVYASKKYRPLIYEAFIKEIENSLKKNESKLEYIASDNKKVILNSEYFLYDDEKFDYIDFEAVVLLKNKPKLMTDDVELVLGIFSPEIEFTIPLTVDLLEAIKDKDLKIINQEDFDYFLDNMEVCTKKLLRAAAFQYHESFLPLFFEKNKEEKKVKRKINLRIILINAGVIVFLLGLTALFTWLGATESGLKISDSIVFNLGFKIIFSVVILGLGLIKSKEIKFYGKACFILYLVLYWYGMLFLNNRYNLLINLLFFVLFVVVGIIVLDKTNLKNKPMNRLIGFAMFIFITFMLNTNKFELMDENRIFAFCAIISGVSLIPFAIIANYYYRKQYKNNNIKKSVYISSVIFVPIGISIVLLLFISFTFINLNYALDNSNPIRIEEEIIALEKGGDYASDSAVIMINNEKIEIPISRADYFEFEVGDTIEVLLYSGRFGYEYYIFE